ncbi:MAG: hypothetical protein IKB34_03135, partial [Clostridia bacterium]|nr:hypothetical protein [Clostridia bacterium]
SYYMQYINLDSEGWSTYMISTSELSSSRAPSIAHIEKITINTTGWTMADLNANATVPAEETVVYLESFEILVYG